MEPCPFLQSTDHKNTMIKIYLELIDSCLPSLLFIPIYTITLRDYIATLPWTPYHGVQNIRDYGTKPFNFYNIICFYKKGEASP